MRVLFIISGSIAVKKCQIILKQLSRKKVHVDCIVTNSAKKIIKKKLIQKCIKGKIFFDSSEKNKKMLHITLTRKSDLVVVLLWFTSIINLQSKQTDIIFIYWILLNKLINIQYHVGVLYSLCIQDHFSTWKAMFSPCFQVGDR